MENLTEDLEAMWALLDRDEPDHAEMRESFSALRNAETSVRGASQFAQCGGCSFVKAVCTQQPYKISATCRHLRCCAQYLRLVRTSCVHSASSFCGDAFR